MNNSNNNYYYTNFYNNGGGKGLKIAPQNQTLPFDKLNLTGAEKQHIISFLKTLTDTVQTAVTPVNSTFR